MTEQPRVRGRFGAASERDRFFEKVEMDQPDECWIWVGVLATNGYGRFWTNGHMRQAHRVSYEWAKGPVPAGLQLDHLCRVKRCVNPAHLEQVTRRENQMRGAGGLLKKTCPRGHPYDGLRRGGTVEPGRYCKTCANMQARNRWRSRRSLAGAETPGKGEA